ncbi:MULTISPECIES: DUF6316 family protein [Pseudomonas]|uniref:DUF6316 domain-containing protein n=1 Tax=Pseudomonas eucalypticola TaxID=2599595 RepID=A0A7D5D9M3_9PSED|nr:MULTISPECIES: DUF6316 family protein [Pseudomonas]QKZ06212.1 hypothetical protein HWQ56_21505 [Pseudomonas eucalypticola]WAH60292.1 DUF6316 family protein [Pseudomonas silvicola]
MYGKRAQDPADTVHYRSDRVIMVNGEFFFTTRENTQEGPYPSKEIAARETEAYIARMQGRA